MKSSKFDKTKLVMVVLLAALLSNVSIAQETFSKYKENLELGLKENAILTLIKGVENDNSGLKRSCIYLAGFYQIEELVGALVKQIEREEDPEIRIFIAFALYQIGNKEGIKAVEQLMINDKNPVVKEMSTSLLNHHRAVVSNSEN